MQRKEYVQPAIEQYKFQAVEPISASGFDEYKPGDDEVQPW